MATKRAEVVGTAEPEKSTGEEADLVVIHEEDETTTDKKFIRYVGSATRRVITNKDWKQVIEDNGDKPLKEVQWTRENDHVVEASQFSSKQIAYLLKTDGRFKATDK